MSNILEQWASENKIKKSALSNLLERFGVLSSQFHNTFDGRESSLQNQVRLFESRRGTRLFRNNSGVAYDKNGRPVRFGLANDSAELNRKVKSSDLIGIEPGGRFVSLEIKSPGWIYSGTARERAQLEWIVFINAMGGRSKFVSSLVDYE
jgi:hypothetical protein